MTFLFEVIEGGKYVLQVLNTKNSQQFLSSWESKQAMCARILRTAQAGILLEKWHSFVGISYDLQKKNIHKCTNYRHCISPKIVLGYLIFHREAVETKHHIINHTDTIYTIPHIG